ncbi:MAG TPA: S-layer protein, partial [Planctomycetaceae bacterium]|nr:S-layer protein [Planctomycetaceae bacterium]
MPDRLLSGLSIACAVCVTSILGSVHSRRAFALEPLTTENSTAGSSRADSEVASPVSFELDVQPILSAHGCNAGACHGKQRGQNGFQLSLLGFDSDSDYNALVHQARGRRLSIVTPEQSLLLQKATAQLPHGGGQKIAPNSHAFATLADWIRQGAPRRLADEPQLESVTLAEKQLTLSPQAAAQLSVTAHYSDGTQRDVTKLTGYLSNDATIVDVDELGKLKAGPIPGETAVMARYMNVICVANVSIPRVEKLPSDFYAQQPRNNFVDELIYEKLAQIQVRVSAPAPQHVFLRRAFTDIIGRLPTPEEATQFLDSSAVTKKAELIDYLLRQPEYVDHWANQWADLLRPNPYRVGIKAVLNYDNWIRQQFRDNIPYDEFARRLITAKGSTWHNGAATLYRDRRSPDEIATLISQLFLGVRLECAKCHHHPFEKWSQHDFYSFAAYFGKVGRKGTGLSPPISGSEEIMFVSNKGEVRHPVTDSVLSPKPLFGSADPAG